MPLFTDLVGFTPLMEANASRGREGAEALLKILNNYFATMLEIISKSGGNLLEFTGGAMPVQFPPNERGRELNISYQIGMAQGSAFSAEFGEPRGRREFNILGDTFNTALHPKHLQRGGFAKFIGVDRVHR